MFQGGKLAICIKYCPPSTSQVILTCHITLQLWGKKCFTEQSLLSNPSSTEEEGGKDVLDFTG